MDRFFAFIVGMLVSAVLFLVLHNCCESCCCDQCDCHHCCTPEEEQQIYRRLEKIERIVFRTGSPAESE